MTINNGGKYPENWTVRDEFAAKAMQAIASTNAYSITQIAEFAYTIANTMIAEREKE